VANQTPSWSDAKKRNHAAWQKRVANELLFYAEKNGLNDNDDLMHELGFVPVEFARYPTCAKLLGPIVRELQDKGLSQHAIAAELNKHKIPTPNGRPWSRGTVNRLISETNACSYQEARQELEA
jgi:hypothetical protein